MARDDKTTKSRAVTDFMGEGNERIQTGIIALDVVLGNGFEKGDMIEIASPSGVGKSTLMLAMLKNLVPGLKAVYCDVERGVKKEMLESMRMTELIGKKEGDAFLLVHPVTFTDLDEIFQRVLEKSLADVIIVDSITALMPSKLQDKGVEEIEIGLTSRLTAAFLMKYKAAIRAKGVTVWLVNQMRTHINTSFGGKTTEESAGGKALEFYPDLRLKMRMGPKMERKEKTLNGEDDVIFGNFAAVWAVKNRGERPMIEVTMPIIFGRGVSNILTAKEILTSRGIITGGGGGFYQIKWPVDGDGVVTTISVRGTDNVHEWIKANLTEIRKTLKDKGWLKLTSGEMKSEAGN